MKKVNKMRAACFAKLGGSVVAIAVAATLGAPTAAWAQTSESTLRGTAPAGATVVAKSIDTGAVRETTANPDGSYVIVGLPAGSYHVIAGGKQSGDVDLSVASVSVLDFGSESRAATDKNTIVVTGRRESVETHSSQVNSIVSLHDIAELPQATRNFMEFADSVPGMQFSVGAGGVTSLRGGAQVDSAINVFIDGVSQKDLIGGGSGFTGSAGAGGNGDAGNPFPQSAIGEYKVVTSNYSAEYGDASSAVVIAQTKSGTNHFHGDVFGDFTNQNLRAADPAEIASGQGKQAGSTKEYGASLGGPIIKDVLHFFAAWEHKSLTNAEDVFPNGVTTAVAQTLLKSLPNVASQFGPTSNPLNENLYFAKLDFEPSSRDRIELSTNLRIEHEIAGANGLTAPSASTQEINDDKRALLTWQHSADRWSNEVHVDYQNTSNSTASTAASPQQQYVFFPNLATPTSVTDALINVGGPGSGVGAISKQTGFTLKDDLTFTNLHFAGDHTLKFGVSFASIKLTTANASSDLANATYSYAVTPTGVQTTPYEVQYPILAAGVTSASVTTTDKKFGAYVQDNWDVNSHLEINLGLRMDHEVVPAFLNYVTPAYVVAALNGPFSSTVSQSYASVLAQGNGSMPGYNISNYISTGSNRKSPYNFSPRLGFSYDFGADNKHVLFGGYARSYNVNQFGNLALETTKIALNGNPQVYFPSAYTQDSFGPCATAADTLLVNNGPNHHCYAWDQSYLTPAGLSGLPVNPSSHEIDLLNNNLKTPHSDQFTLGIRNKMGDWNWQATAQYVESYDGIVGRFGNRYSNGAYFNSTGSQWGASGVPGAGALILWDNGTKDRDFQFSLAAQKPYTKQSGWGMTASYTFSAAAQNNLAGGNNPYQLNTNSYLFDLPYANQYPMLRSTAVPKSRLVVTAPRDLFWGIKTAGKLSLATPNSATVIYGCPNVCNSEGGTTIFSSRTPSALLGYKDLDLQFSKNFTLPGKTDAYVRVDLLNVFNWHNYDPAAYNFDTSKLGPNPTLAQLYALKPTANTTGPIVGLPFTLKLSAGLKF